MSTLTGYLRDDGRWGLRNHVLVLPVRAGANHVASAIAQGLDGVVAVNHQSAGDERDDRDRIRRALLGTATHPNVGQALIVGISDRDLWIVEEAAAAGRPVLALTLAQAGGMAKAIDRGRALAREAVARCAQLERTPMPVSELIVGLECGGSDALSGITANPALGVASDLIVAAGGTSILAETPELIGAEEILARRAVDATVADEVRATILAFEQGILDLGIDVRGAQPTPGNQAGGLTTIEEKSLGAAKKGGSAPVAGVLDYAVAPTRHGLQIMDTPGQDIEQMVGMVAGGAQIVAFTTGRGTPTGSPIAPCLKIATNSRTFERLAGDIDLDAGTILTRGESVADVGRRIHAALLAAAAGELTASERRGNREFAISRTSFVRAT